MSMGSVPGSREAISGTVLPSPFVYCVLMTAGILSTPAARISSLRVAHQLFFLKNRGQEFFLNIDHQKGALVGLQRAARNFGVIGSKCGDILEHG